MRCSHCGYHNSDDTHRCTHCGRRFEAASGGSAFAADVAQGAAKPAAAQRLPATAPIGTPRPGGRRADLPPPRGDAPPSGQLPPPRNQPPQAAPLLPARAAAPAETPRGAQAAPLRLRAAACLLDGLLIAAAAAIFVAGFAALRSSLSADSALEIGSETAAAVFFVLLCFYWLLFLYFAGRTPGMEWLQLEIAALDGEAPTDSQRLMRVLGTIVSTATFGIGFAWALVDERKLTFHDIMSKTMIVESVR